MQITEQFVQQVSPPPIGADGKGTQAFYRDSSITGFGLRVASGGTKSFILEKRIEGKVKRITLGRYGKLDVAQARAKAEKLLQEIQAANRPRITEGQITRREIPLQEAYADYLAAHQQLKKNTRQDYQRSIDGPLQDWLAWPLLKITADQVMSLHAMYGSQSQARINNAMRLLRAIFNHAQQHYLDETGQALVVENPVEVLTKEHAWYDIKARQSYIPAEALPRWWQATLKLKSETARDYLHFLLCTGLRHSSTSRLSFADVDFEKKLLLVKQSKKEGVFILPLSDYVNELLRRRAWASPGTRGYIFPGARTNKPLTEPRSAVKRVQEKAGIPFTLYDLRRTYLQLAEQSGINDPANLPKMVKAAEELTTSNAIEIESIRQVQQTITNRLLTLACASS